MIAKKLALGSSDGTISMAVDVDSLTSTHGVVTDQEAEVAIVSVAVRAAQSVLDLFPNVVKIDFEGHDGAVLDGFEQLLPDV